MTEVERAEAARRGGSYGLWVTATISLPLSAALVSFIDLPWASPWLFMFSGSLIVLHLVCIPLWQMADKRFLCSTAWAKQHRFTPEQLSRFGRKADKKHWPLDDDLA
jgi:hypothetical protein